MKLSYFCVIFSSLFYLFHRCRNLRDKLHPSTHRDREDQIAKYEDGPRMHRLHTDNDIGKHYLLETYLNGLHDIDAKCGDTTTSNDDKHDTDKELTTTPGNSDSGVNTEEIATSPDVGRTGSSSSNSDTNNAHDKQPDAKAVDAMEGVGKRDKSAKKAAAQRKSGDGSAAATSREAKLRAEHQLRKEFCDKMEQMQAAESAPNDGVDGITAAAEQPATARKELNVNDHLAGQIELLEKVISINKHIQREEELLVRLNAKVRKIEVADPSLSETEMQKVLDRINANIDESSTALAKTEHELSASHRALMSKAQLVEALNEELKALELTEAATGGQHVIQVPSHQVQIHSPSDMVGGGGAGGGDAKVAEQRRVNFDETATVVHLPAPVAPAANPPPQPAQATAQFGKPMKTGTLPKLISSVLKKTSQLSAKNTFSGTIPKVKQQPQCNRVSSTALNCNAATGAAGSGAVAGGSVSAGSPANAAALNSLQAEKNNSASVADQLMLSQAPLFYQKANANGVAMQLIDQRNLKANNFSVAPAMSGANNTNNCNSINLNNSTLANCSKIGPKKLINGFYKDPDSDTGLGSFSEDLLQHVGTLV